MSEPTDDETWNCRNCGSEEPHNAITLPFEEEFEDEVEVDVTCKSVYITPIDGLNGFGFTHDEFERMIEHYNASER